MAVAPHTAPIVRATKMLYWKYSKQILEGTTTLIKPIKKPQRHVLDCFGVSDVLQWGHLKS